MKKLARNIVATILGNQIRRLCKKNDIKVIGIVGSIGKTSTKLAVAKVLSSRYSVRHQEGNYNHLVTAPLVFFGESTPSLFNPLAWLMVFLRNEKQIRQKFPFDIVVLELGSDGPGQLKEFKKYLRLEIAVVTAITPEHMAFFRDLDEVAREELSVQDYSSLMLINRDLCDDKYIESLDNKLTYSLKKATDYKAADFEINQSLSIPEQYSHLAAAAVGTKLGIDKTEIKGSFKNIKPFSGRMQQLKGIKDSLIIDDSYNSSPEAVKLALDTLYKIKAPQKIALLGSMNELGSYSPAAHQEIGDYCDSKKIDLLITLGPDANKYLAPAAEAQGCRVQKFDSPYDAGGFIKQEIKSKAAVLVKGSQNKVFAEEAIKSILADSKDATKLVRQTPQWLKIKQRAFKK